MDSASRGTVPQGSAVLRLDLLEDALARVRTVLARRPEEGDAEADRRWLAEVDALLESEPGVPGAVLDRSDLLLARAEVARRLSAPILDLPRPSGPIEDPVGRFGADFGAAFGLGAGAGTGAEPGSGPGAADPATGYTLAAIAAMRADEVSDALELAVRGLVAFDGLPGATSERAAEGRMAAALGSLCREFFDNERALRFFQIATDLLSPAHERIDWTAAASEAADLALIRARELKASAEPASAELLSYAERTAHRVASIGSPRHAAVLASRRLLAGVRCENGAPNAAWQLLEHTDRAVVTAEHCPDPAARRELAAIRICRGRCRFLLDALPEALTELDAALHVIDPENDLVLHVEALRLRAVVRELAGDLHGSLVDTRVLLDRVWTRHQRQIGGFMDQVWGRAWAESRRRDLEVREQVLIRTAEQDPLTGLINRRGMERFCAELDPREGLCLVLADIDHFKAVNDRFGHSAGDSVLRSVASVLSGAIRGLDRVSRWGGEEFLVVMPVQSVDFGAEAANRIRQRVAEQDWSWVADDLRLTISAGVACGSAADLEELLLRADHALYQAKHEGRNRVVVR